MTASPALARHTLWVPHWHPAPLNQLVGHRMKAGRLKKTDRDMVAAYALLQRTPKASGKRRVQLEIVLGKGQRKHDPDAFFKSLLDALVKAELLVDDSDRWVVCDPVVYSRGREWGSRIVLVEMGGETTEESTP